MFNVLLGTCRLLKKCFFTLALSIWTVQRLIVKWLVNPYETKFLVIQVNNFELTQILFVYCCLGPDHFFKKEIQWNYEFYSIILIKLNGHKYSHQERIYLNYHFVFKPINNFPNINFTWLFPLLFAFSSTLFELPLDLLQLYPTLNQSSPGFPSLQGLLLTLAVLFKFTSTFIDCPKLLLDLFSGLFTGHFLLSFSFSLTFALVYYFSP